MSLDATERAVIEWLASLDAGWTSSKTMAFWLAFGIRYRRPETPYDRTDFLKCVQLLALAPSLRGRLPMMAGVSPEWARLMTRWDEIEAAMKPGRIAYEETIKMIEEAVKPVGGDEA